MGKNLFKLLKQTFGSPTKYWQDLSIAVTQKGTVIKKSLHKDGTMKALTKTYAKGSHMADLGVKETRALWSKTQNNMASHGGKPYFVRDGFKITLTNGKRLNLSPEQTKEFFKAANTYKNYSSLKV